MILTAARVQRAVCLYDHLVHSEGIRSIPPLVTSRARLSTQTLRLLERQRPVDGFPSIISQSTSRRKVETICEQIQRIVPQSGYQVIITGEYRRGAEDVKEACFLVVGLQDNYEAASSLSALENWSKKKEELASRRVNKGIINPTGGSKYVCPDNAEFPIEVHYVSKAFHGAALLYLTGDDSYIRFLKIMAMEGMGLTLDKLGLWRLQQARPKRQTHAIANDGLPAGMAIESLDGESVRESERDRRIRATRKQMGLPEGLDLSLDLGPVKKPEIDKAESIMNQIDSNSDELVRVKVRNQSEESAILNVLGLVCIPPSMRTVKEPEEI